MHGAAAVRQQRARLRAVRRQPAHRHLEPAQCAFARGRGRPQARLPVRAVAAAARAVNPDSAAAATRPAAGAANAAHLAAGAARAAGHDRGHGPRQRRAQRRLRDLVLGRLVLLRPARAHGALGHRRAHLDVAHREGWARRRGLGPVRHFQNLPPAQAAALRLDEGLRCAGRRGGGRRGRRRRRRRDRRGAHRLDVRPPAV